MVPKDYAVYQVTGIKNAIICTRHYTGNRRAGWKPNSLLSADGQIHPMPHAEGPPSRTISFFRQKSNHMFVISSLIGRCFQTMLLCRCFCRTWANHQLFPCGVNLPTLTGLPRLLVQLNGITKRHQMKTLTTGIAIYGIMLNSMHPHSASPMAVLH